MAIKKIGEIVKNKKANRIIGDRYDFNI